MRKIKCKTNEIVKTYKQYLKTKHWKLLRERFFASSYSHGRCYFCSSQKVQLHHKTYERLGNENLSDLVEVCRKHHKAVHNDGLKFKRRRRTKITDKLTKKQRTKAMKLRNKNIKYTEKVENGVLIKVYRVPRQQKKKRG